MIVPEELALGLLLIASSFFFALTLASYRRSGVKTLLWMTSALGIHAVATLILIIATLISESISDTQRLYLVIGDGVALALIFLLGTVEGRGRG